MFVEKIAGQECETAARFYRPMMLDLNIFSGAKKKMKNGVHTSGWTSIVRGAS